MSALELVLVSGPLSRASWGLGQREMFFALVPLDRDRPPSTGNSGSYVWRADKSYWGLDTEWIPRRIVKRLWSDPIGLARKLGVPEELIPSLTAGTMARRMAGGVAPENRGVLNLHGVLPANLQVDPIIQKVR